MDTILFLGGRLPQNKRHIHGDASGGEGTLEAPLRWGDLVPFSRPKTNRPDLTWSSFRRAFEK